MRIVELAENTANPGYEAVHGLSLYIETKLHKILFDLGPDETLFHNAKIKGIDLREVDTVIISHGHKDHGGALGLFLKYNSKAKIYIQRKAFLDHFNLLREGKDAYIGLDQSLKENSRIKLLDGDYTIDSELSLFKAKNWGYTPSSANEMLYEENRSDDFSHEQNLIINSDTLVLIMGCGHNGILNILRTKPLAYQYVIGGYHLYNRKKNETVGKPLLDEIVEGLKKYPNTIFYTCHCTGIDAYNYLSKYLDNIKYLKTGDEIEA